MSQGSGSSCPLLEPSVDDAAWVAVLWSADAARSAAKCDADRGCGAFFHIGYGQGQDGRGGRRLRWAERSIVVA